MSRSKIWLLTFFLMAKIPSIFSYKILITSPSISGSMNIHMYRFGDLLGKAGHEVTIWNPMVFEDAKKPKTRFIRREISFTISDRSSLDKEISVLDAIGWGPLYEHFMTMIVQHGLFALCMEVVGNLTHGLLQELRKERFDVIIIHEMDFCAFGIAHLLDIEATIWMSKYFVEDQMAYYGGTPYPSAYIPTAPVNKMAISDHMTFRERVVNAFFHNARYIVELQIPILYTLRIFCLYCGWDFPSIPDLIRQSQLHFINADPFFEYPRPQMPNNVYVGGLANILATNNVHNEELDDEWVQLLNNSLANENGVVIFSLGTLARTDQMPLEHKSAFLNAFKLLPFQFIWRIDGELPSNTREVTNVFVTRWIPQHLLLAHKNVKAFITHGGYNSFMEAIYAGVPVVVMPLFYDQPANAKRIQRLGIGVQLDKNDLSEEIVYLKLKEVLNPNNKYYNNSKRLAQMISDKSTRNLHQVIRWVESVARTKHLPFSKTPANQLRLLQYSLIDVFAVCIIFISLLFFLFASQRGDCPYYSFAFKNHESAAAARILTILPRRLSEKNMSSQHPRVHRTLS